MMRSPPMTRHSQTTAYLMFASAGVAAVIFPSPSVEESAGHFLTAIWVSFLFLGGTISAAGRICGRWAGELVGLPLLAGALAVYALALAYNTISTSRLTAITAAFALGGIFFLVMARWVEVNEIRAESVKGGQVDRDDQETARRHRG